MNRFASLAPFFMLLTPVNAGTLFETNVDFEAEFDRAVSAIADAPERWMRLSGDVRRFVFPRFPFSLIYRYTENLVLTRHCI